MTWQDDYYVGSSDYPASGEDEPVELDPFEDEPVELDPWADPAYVRDEDAE